MFKLFKSKSVEFFSTNRFEKLPDNWHQVIANNGKYINKWNEIILLVEEKKSNIFFVLYQSSDFIRLNQSAKSCEVRHKNVDSLILDSDIRYRDWSVFFTLNTHLI